MSLYQWIDLFRRERRLFWGVVVTVWILAIAFSHFQPERSRAEVLLSITRTAVPETTEYTYDHFYRFQADERLAESLVAYLSSATGRQAVAEAAHLRDRAYARFTRTELRIARQGANLVRVEYTTSDRTTATSLGAALALVANRYVASLNDDARERTWFTILSDPPVVESGLIGRGHLILSALLGGFFAAFWAVLGRFFWRNYREYQLLNIPTHPAGGKNQQ